MTLWYLISHTVQSHSLTFPRLLSRELVQHVAALASRGELQRPCDLIIRELRLHRKGFVVSVEVGKNSSARRTRAGDTPTGGA